jgi:hypothetical protein
MEWLAHADANPFGLHRIAPETRLLWRRLRPHFDRLVLPRKSAPRSEIVIVLDSSSDLFFPDFWYIKERQGELFE